MRRRGRSNRAFRWFYEVESRCTAMLADALATAAFVLGPEDGLALLESNGVDGPDRNGRLAAAQNQGIAPCGVEPDAFSKHQKDW